MPQFSSHSRSFHRYVPDSFRRPDIEALEGLWWEKRPSMKRV